MKRERVIYIGNAVAVGVHCANALGVLVTALVRGRNPQYYLTYEVPMFMQGQGGETTGPSHNFGGNNTVVQTLQQSESVALSVPGIVVSFFVLSAAFQSQFSGSMRFIEYTFSASIMVMLMVLQAGTWNMYAVFGSMLLSAVCMLAGYVAEELRDVETAYYQTKKIPWPSFPLYAQLHFIGWVAILGPLSFMWASFATAVRYNDNVPPAVIAMVVVESVCFLSFGGVQLLYFMNWLDTHTAHICYIFLSLLAKTVLGWIVVGETVV